MGTNLCCRNNLAPLNGLGLTNLPKMVKIPISEFMGKTFQAALLTPGLLSLGVPDGPWHTQILADQLSLFQPGGQIMPA